MTMWFNIVLVVVVAGFVAVVFGRTVLYNLQLRRYSREQEAERDEVKRLLKSGNQDEAADRAIAMMQRRPPPP